ncbi:MAG TPA: flippase [Bacteroidota bacterium]|nr:flippase [Bacteroidota bacterium]
MKRLTRNISSLLLSDIARRTLGFATVAYLARAVGVAGFGAVNLAFTVLSYLIMVSSAGLHVLGTRAVARGGQEFPVDDILGTRLVNSLVLYIILLVVLFVLIPDRLLFLLMAIACLSAFPQSVFLEWYFQGTERMSVFSYARTLSALVYLVLVIVFVHTPRALLAVGAAAVAGDVCAAIFMWRVYRRDSPALIPSVSWTRWKSLMTQSLPMGAGTILGHLSINFPPIAVALLLSVSDVGIYSAASKLVFFLLMADRILATVLLPAASRLHAATPEAMASNLSVALRWVAILGIPATAGALVVADKIFLVVFGAGYAPSVIVFRVLIWYFLLTMFHTIYSSGLLASGGEKEFSSVMQVSALLYFVSSLLFIHAFGPTGAAFAVVLSEAATVLLMKRKLSQRLRLRATVPLGRIVFASLVMAAFVIVLPELRLPGALVIGACVYGGVIVGSGAVSKNDWSDLKERFV